MSYQVTSFKGVLVVKQHQLEEKKKERELVSTRGQVRGISRKSRKNLITLINKLEISDCYYYYTLTYQNWEDDNAKLWKKQLNRVFSALRYKYPDFSAVWRLEFQKRKAPHYHILFHLPTQPDPCSFGKLIKKYWSSALGVSSPKKNKGFWRHSVKGGHIGSDYKNCALYSALYSAKDANDRTNIVTGREWGTVGKAHLPITQYSFCKISPKRQTILRRICRKWLQAYQRQHGYARYLSSPQGSFTIYLPIHVQERLMDFVKNFEPESSSIVPLRSGLDAAA